MAIQTIGYKGTTWYNAVAETDADLHDAVQELREKFQFHELALEDCMAEKQRPKVDDYEKYLFIVLHFPRYNKGTGRIETREVKVFLGEDYVVTLHTGSLKPLLRLVEDVEHHAAERRFHLGKGSGYFLYEIISKLLAYCFPMLDKISSNMSELEQDILNEQGDVVHDRLREILLIKRNIIRFRRIVLPTRSVIVSLENMQTKLLPQKLNAYFDDALDQIERMWDLLTSYKELIEALQDTNTSIITNRTNNVVKVLTAVSIILLPLTFITGLYGMNLARLPFAQHPLAFVIMIAAMLAFAAVVLTVLKSRKWL